MGLTDRVKGLFRGDEQASEQEFAPSLKAGESIVVNDGRVTHKGDDPQETDRVFASLRGQNEANELRQTRAQDLGVSAEQIERSDAFDAKYGPNALQYASPIPEEPLNEYNLVTTLNTGAQSTYTIHSPDLEDATKQAWRELAKDENVAAAKLEWDGGNEVSYIYDRKQGVEIDRPADLVLPHEREQQREQQTQRVKESPATQKQGHSREDLVRQLRAYAGKQIEAQKRIEAQKTGGYKYQQAEAAIALNLANQLEAGAKTIDLSQRYATDDPAAAQARHQRALENLAPVLREAEKQTEKLSHGQAIAHGKGEVLALQNLEQGLANTSGLLQRAGQHNNHQTQAPRLSMSDGGI